jgi:hypothetical protein
MGRVTSRAEGVAAEKYGCGAKSVEVCRSRE